ncbi:MAG: hypothetical protein KQH63_21705 [Desulfobulbaceae bacterium]|nr:hypothetical protein [Desulfobulbaceae bacterium]
MVEGSFSFSAETRGYERIDDTYQLKIIIPDAFPGELPSVIETGGKIPRDGNYHVNPGNNTLCLGSPLRLFFLIREERTLVKFAEKCLVPYLYAISHRLRFGGDFPFGELAHGQEGIVFDYMNLFRLKSREQVLSTLEILSKRKRVANKRPCPCGCRKSLGSCDFRWKINKFRLVASRRWFRQDSLGGNT